MDSEFRRNGRATRKRVIAILSDVIQEEVSDDTEDLRQADIPAWDSFSHIRLILELEESFGIRIADEEAVALTSLSAIESLLEDKVSE